VIQQTGLFPHRTIAQNIATVPDLLGWDKTRIGERVGDLIKLVGLEEEMADRYPGELSGGQQQRVGVARALAADPPVLLMDEPFGAVDPIVRGRLQDEMLSLQERVHKTIVFVTHDIDEAIKMGDRIAILNVGGVLEQFGPPEEILREPANGFVEEFLGGERGLKRLALLPIASAGLQRGPVVQADAGTAEATEVAEAAATDWVVVLSGDSLLGWVAIADLAHVDGVMSLDPQPFLVELGRDSSLREALDAVVTSHARVAVVVDGDRYLGLLDVDAIGEGVTE
jgi:osmoprotectant transport system ATP-binding protein